MACCEVCNNRKVTLLQRRKQKKKKNDFDGFIIFSVLPHNSSFLFFLHFLDNLSLNECFFSFFFHWGNGHEGNIKLMFAS